MEINGKTTVTANKPVLIDKDEVEWHDEILLYVAIHHFPATALSDFQAIESIISDVVQGLHIVRAWTQAWKRRIASGIQDLRGRGSTRSE